MSLDYLGVRIKHCCLRISGELVSRLRIQFPIFQKMFDSIECLVQLMHDSVPPPPGQPPGQVQPFGSRGRGNCLKRSCPGVGGGENKNFLLCDFFVISHAVYMIAAGMDYVFVRKNEGIFRRVVGE